MRQSGEKQRRRVGVYGWGVIAPGARNVDALDALLRSGSSALRTASRPELGVGLFAVGDPDFDVDDYTAWIAERKGEAFATRLKKKMGDNVLFALGATVQAMRCEPKLEAIARELDDGCHVYVGSGVGDLPQSYAAARALDRATREWNQFWADPVRCPARKTFEETGDAGGEAPPPAPTTFPIDSEARHDARLAWDEFWAARSSGLKQFFARLIAVENAGADGTSEPPPPSKGKQISDKAHIDAIRRRLRALRALLDEVGCPPPPWTAVSPDLIWNIQNAPAAQITMLLDVHGAAWAPIGACSTFGVALKCGRDAVLSGEAKMAIVGTTDPRPDPCLAGAFHEARVMAATGEVNSPFTNLRGTHLSGGSCIWILADEEHMRAQGVTTPPIGGWVEAVALSSDAEHIITPSISGPKRAMARAFEEAGVTPADIAMADLHATGTPGDLNELSLVQDFVNADTRITARKGQLGHGMANSGGWELTGLALGLRAGEAIATDITANEIHPNVRNPASIVTGSVPLKGHSRVGFKLMLGIGGITACVIMRHGS